mmetsp:Transcript_10208/g.16503  ORF Transcript_10208/g.16503 Transcript_10208/m.16503 type:complete len:203 (-) Transcript_10208:266-874(-)|eukprot:CAMPEP_0194559684 /NCGR_PEP_ID=MMETSP0292-20121207/1147_1 /TAXON_ID=39354 /ORGANISM="Heterosigma akashiwo, Strain CCMP2393" /LENGTH=202 /DNA_ID=CAMNT_0039407675 /DNA_START=21 /DNA_END=629 /DNA_ORIENTATION=+
MKEETTDCLASPRVILAYYWLMLRDDYADFVPASSKRRDSRVDLAKDWWRLALAMGVVCAEPIICIVWGYLGASESSECKKTSSWLVVVGWVQFICGLSYSCVQFFLGDMAATIGKGYGKPMFFASWLGGGFLLGWSIYGLTYLQYTESGCSQMSQWAYSFAWVAVIQMGIFLFYPPWAKEITEGAERRSPAENELESSLTD